MRPPPGESDTAVSDALLPSFSTFASGSAGRERTLCPAGAPNNGWREEPSRVKRLPPVLPGRAYDLVAAAVATDLESGGASAAGRGSNRPFYPEGRRRSQRPPGPRLHSLPLTVHQESVAPTASSWASVSASSFPSSGGPASAPSTCCFSCSPDGSHPVVVAPCSGGPPRMCPKIKQEAVSSCTVGRPLAHLDAGPQLSHGHRPSARDFPWGGSSPAGLPRLGPEERLSRRACHSAQPLPPGFHPHPGPNYPAFLPDQMQPQVPPLHHQELVPPGSCLPEEPKPKRGRRSWPRRRTATHACDYAAAAKPIPRVLISRHTCEPTQVRNPTTVTGTAAGGNLRALKN
ncbi:Krueppel-like factor 4 [Sciurus carolinensis]|uniref:Krueppel-like factor 4 n=1 Tax=Sciurus carolinensis TaxID=30640 RepID=A0AA41T816_SCICA|nr:Krueppel-like factor 4 [Sciurus carolinensis]